MTLFTFIQLSNDKQGAIKHLVVDTVRKIFKQDNSICVSIAKTRKLLGYNDQLIRYCISQDSDFKHELNQIHAKRKRERKSMMIDASFKSKI
jgi:hypothetical protein